MFLLINNLSHYDSGGELKATIENLSESNESGRKLSKSPFGLREAFTPDHVVFTH